MSFVVPPSTPDAAYDGIIKSIKGDDPEYLIACLRVLKTTPMAIHLEGEDLLTMAIRNNTRNCIEPLKRVGFSLDRLTTKENKHPLEEALDFRSPVALEYLLKYGSNPNGPHTKYGTIMHAAGATRIIDSLIPILCARKGDPNAVREKDQTTPLHAAVTNVQVINVEQLVERGANINAPDHLGRTPLHLALALEHYDPMAIVLLNYGADPLIPDAGGLTALDLAHVREEPALIKIIEERSSWDNLLIPKVPMGKNKPFKGDEFRQELLQLVKKGDIGKIRELIEHRGGENWPPAKVIAESPMLTALEKKRVDIAALLTGYNLGVHDRGPERRNLVHYLLLVATKYEVLRPFLTAIHKLNPFYLTEPDANKKTPAAFSIEEGAPHDREVIDALIGSIN